MTGSPQQIADSTAQVFSDADINVSDGGKFGACGIRFLIYLRFLLSMTQLLDSAHDESKTKI